MTANRKDRNMDFKKLRTVHLYLGCIFMPMLVFFAVTGCLQMFEWHESRKDGSYHAPQIAEITAEMHRHQRLQGGEDVPHSRGFQFFVVLMGLGFFVTSVLGVMMALQFTSPAVVWGCLGAGTLLPLILLKFFK